MDLPFFLSSRTGFQDYKICARRMECKALRFFKSCNPVSVITIGRGLISPSPQFFVLPLHALD